MKYRRVVISRFGGGEVLQVVEEEVPEPGPGQVLVRVQAAGVAFADLLMRRGLYGPGHRPPFTPGWDVAGVVDRAGPGVESPAAGERVAALTRVGGYSEFVTVAAADAVPVPEGADIFDAACLPLNYVTSWQMLHRAAAVSPGASLLVHAAGGGVGTALLQLAALIGCRVFGTASTRKLRLVQELGGVPIDRGAEDFVERVRRVTGRGVDAAFDPVGGAHARRSYRALRRGGRVVVYGAYTLLRSGRLRSGLDLFVTLALNLVPDGRTVAFYGITRRPYSRVEWCREDLARLLRLVAERRIRPVISHRLPLTEVARAHELLESGATTGKVLLVM